MTVATMDELVAHLQRLTSRSSDPQALAEETAELLAGFPVEAIPACYRCRPADEERGRYMLHREPAFNVTTVIWGPGDRASAHEHRTWGTILVVDNEMEESRYSLTELDDRRALLELTDVHHHRPGALSTLYPGHEVHAMHNTTGTDTLEVHIYGRDLAGMPRRWWQDDGTERELVTPPYLNC